jgi:hypothetical protein
MMTVDGLFLFVSLEAGGTTANEIPVFPSTTDVSTARHRIHLMEDLKKKRILKFLRNFRLDFSKFDTTCIKREGRGLQVPHISNARVIKYTRYKQISFYQHSQSITLSSFQFQETEQREAQKLLCNGTFRVFGWV